MKIVLRWSIFGLFGLLNGIVSIDWNDDIVPNEEQLKTEKQDPLSKYFGDAISTNLELFRSYNFMENLIGKITDVPQE